MNIEISEAVWLDRAGVISMSELAQLSGLSEAILLQLIEYEVLPPAASAAGGPTFTGDCLVTARMACRLQSDFELDAAGLALVLSLLDRIRGLEAEVRGLQAQAPRRPHKA